MKRPAFQFYPADWRNDAGLKLCSLSARGLWIEMICIMHAAEPYGHLCAAGRPLDTRDLSKLVGESERDVKKWLDELVRNNVCSSEEGAIISRRMVRDESLRERRAAGGEAGSEFGHLGAEHGKKGGRPRKETGYKKPPLNPPPSSSSSSSNNEDTAPSAKSPRGTALPKDWELPGDWRTWAEGARPDVDVLTVADSFRDYWVAKPGKEGRKTDWQATWRNWVRNQRAPAFRKAAPAGDIWAGAVN